MEWYNASKKTQDEAFPDDEADDALLDETVSDVERQVALQGQIGWSVNALEPGWFDFTWNPYVDRRSEKMGVSESHYTTFAKWVDFFPVKICVRL